MAPLKIFTTYLTWPKLLFILLKNVSYVEVSHKIVAFLCRIMIPNGYNWRINLSKHFQINLSYGNKSTIQVITQYLEKSCKQNILQALSIGVTGSVTETSKFYCFTSLDQIQYFTQTKLHVKDKLKVD